MASSRLGTALKNLGLALINATLMLVLLIVIFLWLLVGRVQELGANTREALTAALAPQAERLEQISEGIDAVGAQLKDGGDKAELGPKLEALTEEMAQVRAGIQSIQSIQMEAIAGTVMTVVGQWMSARAAEMKAGE